MIPVIEVKDVALRRDGRDVLSRVSLRIDEHELVGLIGPNGGGKTTLLRVILGVQRPDSGAVMLFGSAATRLNRRGGEVGYVAQAKAFDKDFPARAKDVVLMGTFSRLGPFQIPDRNAKEDTMDVLRQVGMEDRAHRPIGRLSGGEQQRVFIAQALVSRPRLLILDEPTVGVDREGEEALIRLLLALKRESSLTILMVSHNVSLIKAHTDRILCLNRELVYSGASSELTDEKIAEAYHAHPQGANND
jgi:zinc transport system ATP-binding protein